MDIIKAILDILNSLLSPIIASIVTYIAYRQWKMNKENSIRDKNAAIIRIYATVKEFLSYVDENRRIDTELFQSYKRAMAEADFFCGQELIDWLDLIETEASCWLDLDRTVKIAIKYQKQNEVTKDMRDMEDSIDNLQNERCNLLNLFKKQLEINKK